jgi:D-glycero-D-manno-heptose 1,7-bisphosphate phosphatase
MSSSSPNKALQKVVFIDRDGVINQDSSAYIKSWSEFKFLPRSLEALQNLSQHHIRSYLITNQSAVNRKLITPETLTHIHTNMLAAIIAAGGRLDDIFFCPHLPAENCNCRKPRPGLILAAQQKYNINLAGSYMIGDSAKDIVCARQAGCGFTLLVKTGNYTTAITELADANIVPDYIAADLFEAVNWIIAHAGQ